MTGARRCVRADARGGSRAPGGWAYGDFPYGLEPLSLPHPDQAAWSDPTAQADLGEAYLDLEAAIWDGVAVTDPATERNLEQVYWFRWITGHHISFILWRLQARQLRKAASSEADRQAAAPVLVELVRAYCGMLLYTGSCTRSVYESVIRPSMYRLHRAFSGTWAPDFRPVRALLNGRSGHSVAGPAADQLARQVALSHRIHLGVAAKLVTDGRSLLQGLMDKQAAGHRRRRSGLFDCCFLTVRAPVSAQEIAIQLLRRERAVVVDLVTNGLYPRAGTATGVGSDELAAPEVADCAASLPEVLLRVAAMVAGQPPADAGSGAEC